METIGWSDAGPPAGGQLETLVYRSRAVAPFPPPALGGLVQAARARNQGEGITGLMVYDDGRFLQWLEGPPDGMRRVTASIHRDRRHTDFEVLSTRPVARRVFDGWAMQLATRDGPDRESGTANGEVAATPALLEGMHQHPDGARALLAALAPSTVTAPAREPRPALGNALGALV